MPIWKEQYHIQWYVYYLHRVKVSTQLLIKIAESTHRGNPYACSVVKFPYP